MKKINLMENKKLKITLIISAAIILCAGLSTMLIFSNSGKDQSAQPTSSESSNEESPYKEKSEPIFENKKEPSDEETAQTFNNKKTPPKSNEEPSENNAPKGFDFTSWNQSCDFNLVVINKDNLIPSNFDLQLSSILGSQIHTKVKDSLEQMINDAKKDGINLYISSGYRSVERQTMLFNRKVNYFKNKGFSQKKAEIEAARIVAKPKTSEHNSGLAVDLNGVRDDFYKTNEYKWLMSNSYKYGFILRYPKDKINITNVIYEPWHFRFVGKEHAQKIVSQNLCLEEYIKSLI